MRLGRVVMALALGLVAVVVVPISGTSAEAAASTGTAASIVGLSGLHGTAQTCAPPGSAAETTTEPQSPDGASQDACPTAPGSDDEVVEHTDADADADTDADTDADADADAVTDQDSTEPASTDETAVPSAEPAQARLTLVATVSHDHGGTAEPTDWALVADGPTSFWGLTGSPEVTDVPVEAGEYSLSEYGPDGYELADLSCTGAELDGSTVSIPTGSEVTCTFDNRDRPATITLVNDVTNDHGGTAGPTDWRLSATGPTSVGGAMGSPETTEVEVSAGEYSLAADGPAGYRLARMRCAGHPEASLRRPTLEVGVGEQVVCTFYHDDIAPTLTLVTSVVNDDGGTAQPSNWTVSATGPALAFGSTGDITVTDAPMIAGTYTLSASGPAGYDWLALSCTGIGDIDPAHPTIDLALGDDVTCTFTNDDHAAHLTLVKVVDHGESGLTDAPGDFTLTARPVGDGDQSVVTGAGDPDDPSGVSEVRVSAGAYRLSESGPSGYVAGAWHCEGAEVMGDRVVVAVGASVRCTIVNTADSAVASEADEDRGVSSGAIPDAGGPRVAALGLGVLALAGGVVMLVVARRRRPE